MSGSHLLRLFLALCVIAGLITWALVHQLEGPDRADARTAPRPEEVVPTPTDVALDELEASELSAHNAPAPATEDRTPVTAVSADGPRILVVDAESQQPLPGLTVWWIDEERVKELQPEIAAPVRAFETSADRFGLAFKTGADGSVRVPRSGSHAYVEARTSTLEGRKRLLPNTKGEKRLVLAPLEDLYVRVLEATGTAAVGVQLALSEEGSRPGSRTRYRTTDEQGLVRFVDVRSLLPLQVAVVLPLAEPVVLRVDRLHPKDSPFDLRLPPTGVVRCVVSDDFYASGQVRLKLFRGTRSPIPESEPSWTGGIESGAAVFAHVGLGLEFRVEVSANSAPSPRRLRGSGPKRAGEVATITTPDDVPVLTGRVLDEQGEPVASQGITVRIQELASDWDSDQFANLRTSSEGRFRFVLGELRKDVEQRRLRVEIDRTRLFALVELPEPLPSRELELGDVRLGEGALVADGRVLDDGGRPVNRAYVKVEYLKERASDPRFDTWTDSLEPSVDTDAEGRFRILGTARPEPRAIRVTKQGTQPSPRRLIAPGEHGIEIVLHTAGSIEGRVLRTEEQSRVRLEVEVLRLEGTTDWPDANGRHWSVNPEGLFRIDSLAPGTWIVRLSQESSDPFFRVEVTVRAGEVTHLEPIDLTSAHRPYTIEVMNEDLEHLGECEVQVVSSVSPGSSTGARAASPGVFHLLAEPQGASIEIQCPGYEPQYLTGVDSDRRVVLRPGIPVRIVAAGFEPVADKQGFLSVRAWRVEKAAGPYHRPSRSFSGTFESGREFSTVVPGEGTYRFSWYASPATPDPARGSAGVSGDVRTFEVRRQKGELCVELTPPPNALAEGLKRLREVR